MIINLYIRKIQDQDITSVIEISNLCFPKSWTQETFRREMLLDNSYFYIGSIENKIVCFFEWWKILDEAHIQTIAVSPKYQHQGIATQCLEYLINETKELNLMKIFLEVRESNIIAQKLYKKNGFEIISHRKNYYNDPIENAVIMIRT